MQARYVSWNIENMNHSFKADRLMESIEDAKFGA